MARGGKPARRLSAARRFRTVRAVGGAGTSEPPPRRSRRDPEGAAGIDGAAGTAGTAEFRPRRDPPRRQRSFGRQHLGRTGPGIEGSNALDGHRFLPRRVGETRRALALRKAKPASALHGPAGSARHFTFPARTGPVRVQWPTRRGRTCTMTPITIALPEGDSDLENAARVA